MGRPRAESGCEDRIPTITVTVGPLTSDLLWPFFRGPLRAYRDSLLSSVTLPCRKYLSTSVAKLAASVVDKSPNQPDGDIRILFNSSHAVRSQSLLNILALTPKISHLVIAFSPFHSYGG
jgi:hypothetical protein